MAAGGRGQHYIDRRCPERGDQVTDESIGTARGAEQTHCSGRARCHRMAKVETFMERGITASNSADRPVDYQAPSLIVAVPPQHADRTLSGAAVAPKRRPHRFA
jgi:hypothetical protein